MAISVRMDEAFVSDAKVHAETEHRSVPKQIEYWAKIGKTMIDNPDLSYEFVRETLLSLKEAEEGMTKRYVRRTPRA